MRTQLLLYSDEIIKRFNFINKGLEILDNEATIKGKLNSRQEAKLSNYNYIIDRAYKMLTLNGVPVNYGGTLLFKCSSIIKCFKSIKADILNGQENPNYETILFDTYVSLINRNINLG